MRARDLLPLALVGGAAAFVGLQILDRPAVAPRPAPDAAIVQAPSPERQVIAQGRAAPAPAEASRAAGAAPAYDSAAVRVMLRDGAPGTYIMAMLAEKQRRLVRWPERQAEPLRVWIARTSSVPNWNPEYPLAVERAFDEWRIAGFPIAFHFVHDSASAQIRIVWAEKFTPENDEDRPIGRANKVYDRQGWLVESHVILATHTVDGRKLRPDLVTGVARHEVGHALGLAHSTDKADVMYPEAYSTKISAADRATLHLLYKLPPGMMP